MSGHELRFIQEAFESNYIAPAGPMLQRFEAAVCAYTGIAHAVAVSSGTAAIHLALRLLDLPPGREVWTGTLTFIGGIGPAVHEGLQPVFFDSSPDTWTIDTDLLADELERAEAAGRLPGAIIATDIFGQSCDLDAVLAICDRHQVPVICDAAESFGARYRDRHAGAGAAATVFSFNGNKIITTSGGGVLASGDPALVERARHLATQARLPQPHYEHAEIGYNYRMSNVLAAIGLGQLQVVDAWVARRRRIFGWYRERLEGTAGITFMPEAAYGIGTRWLTVIEIDAALFGADSEAVRVALEAGNIEARPVWKPMHRQPAFRKARYVGGDVADRIFERGLCLPSGSAMSEDDVSRVTDAILAVRR